MGFLVYLEREGRGLEKGRNQVREEASINTALSHSSHFAEVKLVCAARQAGILWWFGISVNT